MLGLTAPRLRGFAASSRLAEALAEAARLCCCAAPIKEPKARLATSRIDAETYFFMRRRAKGPGRGLHHADPVPQPGQKSSCPVNLNKRPPMIEMGPSHAEP